MIRFTRSFPRSLAIVAALALAGPAAHAEPSPEVRLSLADAIELTLKNNPELAVAGLAPRRAAADVDVQRGVFDPVLSLFGGVGRDRTPQLSAALGSFRNTLTAEASLGGRLPVGTQYELSYGTTRLDSDSQLSVFNPSSSAYVQLDIRQPLLRGFGSEVNRAGITIARGNERIAEVSLRRDTELTIASTVEAYWRLVRAHKSLAVARESLQLAEQLVQRTQARVTAGDLPTIELTQARASVAAREEAVILGEAEVGNANDALARHLVVDPQRVFAASFVPTDEPTGELAPAPASVADAALRQRAELQAARQAVRNAEVALAAARDARRPDLSAVASVGIGGLDARWTSAHSELARDIDDQHRVTAGLVFSVPLGNRAADGASTRAELDLEKARLALRSLELQVTEDVRGSLRDLDASTKRVEATRRASQLAREQLTAGEKRLATGLSTAFEVLRLQTDLAAAQNAEIAALVGHRTSTMRVQLATGALFGRYVASR